MFEWINSTGVKSDKGFEVQAIKMYEIEYRENGKVLTVFFEGGIKDGKVLVIVFKSNFKKWNDGTLILNPDEILKNFTEAMEFQNVGVEAD